MEKLTIKCKKIKQLLFEQGLSGAYVRTYFYRILNRIDKGIALRSNIVRNIETDML